MLVRKTIKAKITALTNTKREKLGREYSNFQKYIRGDRSVELYSATRRQAERVLWRLRSSKKDFKRQPLIIRRDLIKIEKQDTKLSRFWCRIPVYKKSIWVAVEFPYNQEQLLECSIRETKLIRKKDNWFLMIIVQKDVKFKNSYSSVLGIDFGVRWVATVCDLGSLRPKFYGRELREIRGCYFYLRRRLSKKKIRGFCKWIKNNKERRTVNDLLHKISRNIVDWAKETNSLIAFGDLKEIRKHDRGRKFNRKLNSFPYCRLAQYVRYKAEWEGIRVIEVSEAYTSRTCHRCGKMGIRYNGLFKCTNCGLLDNSDRNGAVNIGKRALGYISRAGGSLANPETEAVNKKIPIRKPHTTSESPEFIRGECQ